MLFHPGPHRPLILDVFCGAGGAAVGYQRAGFEVVGVDHEPQPHYPFPFHRAEALGVLADLAAGRAVGPFSTTGARVQREEIALIHASPPCQAYSRATAWRGSRGAHPDLVARTRGLLEATGRPYIIENVEDARDRLRFPVLLCGSLFGLPFRRHRLFEAPSLPLLLLQACRHRPSDYSFDHGRKQSERVYADALGCEWMTVQEARQAVPPAYTHYLGSQLLRAREKGVGE